SFFLRQRGRGGEGEMSKPPVSWPSEVFVPQWPRAWHEEGEQGRGGEGEMSGLSVSRFLNVSACECLSFFLRQRGRGGEGEIARIRPWLNCRRPRVSFALDPSIWYFGFPRIGSTSRCDMNLFPRDQ
ncbi:MAG: hypothetical protein DRJ61_17935, partial [Acidobacteria bacterium]